MLDFSDRAILIWLMDQVATAEHIQARIGYFSYFWHSILVFVWSQKFLYLGQLTCELVDRVAEDLRFSSLAFFSFIIYIISLNSKLTACITLK